MISPDFTGAQALGGSPVRISGSPFGFPGSLPVGEDLPGQARIAEEAAQNQTNPNAPKKPRAGLLPMRVGAQYAVTIKRPQMARDEAQRKLLALQKAHRVALQKEATARGAAQERPGDKDIVQAYLDAANARAGVEELYALTTRAAQRDPREVVQCMAQDPIVMSDAFLDPAHQPVWICTHEKCRGQEWTDHRALQADHVDVARKSEAHVYGLWSKMPIDPDAPIAGVLGLIAPVSSDGTSAVAIARAVAMGGEETKAPEPAAEDVAKVLEEAGKRRGKRGEA